MTSSQIVKKLKEKGCRITPQRKIIIELLVNQQHKLLTADTLIKEARAVNDAINATTIYRNLEALENAQLLYVQKNEEGTNLYKLICRAEHHHHIICKDCGRMEAIDYCPIVPQLKAMVADQGFTLEDHTLELYGHCNRCTHDSTASDT